MISNESINAAVPLVERLNAAGLRIVPIENTPVAALYNAALTPVVDMYEGESGFIEAWQQSLKVTPAIGAVDNTQLDSDGETIVSMATCLYANSIDEASDLFAMSINNAMNHARNVAGPLIRELSERIEEHMSQSGTVSVPYEIVDVSMHPVWENPAIVAVLDKFEATTKTLGRGAVPKITCPDDIAERIKTGAVAIDEALEKILLDSDLTVADIFNDIFNGHGDLGVLDFPYVMGRQRMLARLLVCSMLVDNPVPNSGMNSVAWENLLNQLIDVFACNCKWIYQCYQSDIESRTLVHHIDHLQNRIVLNTPVYDMWLDNGGQPEVIFGALIRSRSTNEAISYQGTLEQASDLLSVWGTYQATERLRMDALRTDRIKNAVKTCMYGIIAELDSESLPPNASRESIETRMLEKVAALTTVTLADTSFLCIDMICDTLFFHTPANYIHMRMCQIIEQGVPADEAAYQVSLEYMVSWACDSLALTKG